jgi:hypothetical protein
MSDLEDILFYLKPRNTAAMETLGDRNNAPYALPTSGGAYEQGFVVGLNRRPSKPMAVC